MAPARASARTYLEGSRSDLVVPTVRGPPPKFELREGLGPEELSVLARDAPLDHAFALYDMERFSERVRFVTVREGGRPVSYLLIWYGDPSKPVVHWVGEAGWEALEKGLPVPPFVAIVPTKVAKRVAWPSPSTSHTIELWVRRRHVAQPALPGHPGGTPRVRRLGPEDREALQRFAERHQDEPDLRALGGTDPGRARVYGALSANPEGEQLLALARSTVELPQVWFVGGVYTEPSHRGTGLGREVTWAVARAAHEAGADCALYVRSDNPAAIAAYTALGFQRVSLRTWVDAGAGPSP